jgi:predicted dehydrogenase
MTIGLAIVGAGYWGPTLVRIALATPAFRLDWLSDLKAERARAVLRPCATVRPPSSMTATTVGLEQE